MATTGFSYAEAIKGPNAVVTKPPQQPKQHVVQPAHSVRYGGGDPKSAIYVVPKHHGPKPKPSVRRNPPKKSRPQLSPDPWLKMDNEDILCMIFGNLSHKDRMILAICSRTLAIRIRLSKIWLHETVHVKIDKPFTPRRLQDVLRATHAVNLVWDIIPLDFSHKNPLADTLVGPLTQLQSLKFKCTVPPMETLKSILPQLPGLTELQLPGRYSAVDDPDHPMSDLIPLIKSFTNLKKLVLPKLRQYDEDLPTIPVPNIHEPVGLDLALRDFQHLESLGIFVHILRDLTTPRHARGEALVDALWPLASKNLRDLKELRIICEGTGSFQAALYRVGSFQNLRSLALVLHAEDEDEDLDLQESPTSITRCVDLERLELLSKYGGEIPQDLCHKIFSKCTKVNDLTVFVQSTQIIPSLNKLPLQKLHLRLGYRLLPPQGVLELFKSFQKSLLLTHLTLDFEYYQNCTQEAMDVLAKIPTLRHLKMSSTFNCLIENISTCLTIHHPEVTVVDLSKLKVLTIQTSFPKCVSLQLPFASNIGRFDNMLAHHFPHIQGDAIRVLDSQAVSISDCRNVADLCNKLDQLVKKLKKQTDGFRWYNEEGVLLRELGLQKALKDVGIKHGSKVGYYSF